MMEILNQLGGMVENAIEEEREICVGAKRGEDTMMLSFVPVDYSIDNGFYVMGDNFSLSIKDDASFSYDAVEDEFTIASGGVSYYFSIV